MNSKFRALLFKSKEKNEDAHGSALFIDNGPDGYFSRQELIHFMTNAEPWQNRHLDLMVQYMMNGAFLSNEPSHVTDNGEQITWLKFKKGKIQFKPLRILNFSNIKQLIDDYASEKIKITESLEQLYNEAIEA